MDIYGDDCSKAFNKYRTHVIKQVIAGDIQEEQGQQLINDLMDKHEGASIIFVKCDVRKQQEVDSQ